MNNVSVNRFFNDLYHECSEGCITLTTQPDRRNYHVPVTELDKAAALAEKLGQKRHTYYNVALRKPGLNAYTRGNEDELSSVVCMLADIDVKGEAHKQEALPETFEEALDFVNGLPFQPSYIISSGNGLHAIWLLDEPFIIHTPDDLKTIRAISTGFGAFILREGQKHGWYLDSVQDLPRMLRCPGTLNFKTDPPKECTVFRRNIAGISTGQSGSAQACTAAPDGNSENTAEDTEMLYADAPVLRYPLDTFIPYKAEEENASGPVTVESGDIGAAEKMCGNCAFIDHCIKNADSLSEPWWHAFLSIVALTEDGFAKGHEWSEPYPGYDFKETEERLKRAVKANKPCSCRYIRNNIGFNCPEGGCRNGGHIVGSPVVFSYYSQDEQVNRLIDSESLSLDEAVDGHNLLLVGYAREHMPSAYILLKQKYQKLKISSRELDRAVKAAQEANLKTSAEQDFFGEILLDGVDTKGLKLPEGWDLSMNGISHMETGGAGSFIRHITFSPVLITKRLENLENGNVLLELAFYCAHDWKYITLPRGEVMDKGKLIKSADVGLPVASNNAADLVKFLSLFEAVNIDQIQSLRSIDHLGWVKGLREFYPYHMDGEAAFDGQTSEAGTVVKAIRQSGDKEKWLDMAVKLRTMPFARAMLDASFASVLLEPLQHRNIYIHLWNASRSGKTAVEKAAVSIWGDPAGLLVSYNGTQVGFERTSAAMRHLPLALDELQSSQMKPDQFSRTVYMLGNGIGRMRGDKYGGTQELLHWHNVILSTGEEPVITGNSMDGMVTRIMELCAAPVKDEAFASQVHQISEMNYGFAGPAFIRWLYDHYLDSGKEGIKKLRAEEEDMEGLIDFLYDLTYGNKAGFHLGNVGVIAFADYISSQAIFNVKEEDARNDAVVFATEILDCIHKQDKADSVDRAWDYIIDWADSNKMHFEVKKKLSAGFDRAGVSPIYGRYYPQEQELRIIPACFYEALDKGGFSAEKCYTGFKDRGYIEKAQRQTRIDGEKRNAIVADIALDLESDDQDDDRPVLMS